MSYKDLNSNRKILSVRLVPNHNLPFTIIHLKLRFSTEFIYLTKSLQKKKQQKCPTVFRANVLYNGIYLFLFNPKKQSKTGCRVFSVGSFLGWHSCVAKFLVEIVFSGDLIVLHKVWLIACTFLCFVYSVHYFVSSNEVERNLQKIFELWKKNKNNRKKRNVDGKSFFFSFLIFQ